MQTTPYVHSCAVWEIPEVIHKVREVMDYISKTLAAKNLFAWHAFVDDLKSDITSEIYKYEDLALQGKYKKTGIGGYCNMARQGALNYASFYSAQKRRINFEALSLDAMIETGDGEIPFQVAGKSDDLCQVELLMAIEQTSGPEVAAMAAKILNGDAIGAAELKKMHAPALLRLLHNAC